MNSRLLRQLVCWIALLSIFTQGLACGTTVLFCLGCQDDAVCGRPIAAEVSHSRTSIGCCPSDFDADNHCSTTPAVCVQSCDGCVDLIVISQPALSGVRNVGELKSSLGPKFSVPIAAIEPQSLAAPFLRQPHRELRLNPSGGQHDLTRTVILQI